MPYRRTENVVRRLAEREEAILTAATVIAAEGGMAAVQIAAVAARAGIAAGTVYRYFPSKTDLVADLVAAVAGRELSAMMAAGNAAPGPLSALAACIATFAARTLNERRLAWAVLGEPVDAQVDAMRLDFRQSLAAELEARIKTAIAGRHRVPIPGNVATPTFAIRLAPGEQQLVGNPMPTRRRRCQPRSRKTLLDYPQLFCGRPSTAATRVKTVSRLIWRVSVRSSIPTISYMPDNSARRPKPSGYQ